MGNQLRERGEKYQREISSGNVIHLPLMQSSVCMAPSRMSLPQARGKKQDNVVPVH